VKNQRERQREREKVHQTIMSASEKRKSSRNHGVEAANAVPGKTVKKE
jgi:hypothetical protein